MTSLRTVRLNVIASVQRLAVLLLLWLAVPAQLAAADAEAVAFTNAMEQFQGGFFGRSELAFSNFVVRFPQSPQIPRAVLYQARSALAENRFPAAIALLSTKSTS